MRNFRYKWMEMNPLNIEMLKILKSSEGFLSEKFLPFEKKNCHRDQICKRFYIKIP